MGLIKWIKELSNQYNNDTFAGVCEKCGGDIELIKGQTYCKCGVKEK